MSKPKPVKARVLELLGEQVDRGLTVNEIRGALGLTEEQQELGRRMREMVRDGLLNRTRQGGQTYYSFRSWEPTQPASNYRPVTRTQRARILWRAQGRCEMCGFSTAEDQVKLHIDHKIPQDWGGSSDDDNLWALCSTCNEGKKNFFATIVDPRIQRAMLHPSVHVRLGELLKAFEGEPVAGKYLELVAYSHDDWQKRLRELRELGWQYHFTKHRDETGRTRVDFILDHWESWPEGKTPAEAIREAERLKGKKR